MAGRGLFVTGTDTDVGKTCVAEAIVRSIAATGRRVGVYKPVASGVGRGPGDARRLWEAAGRPLSVEAVCPQAFVAPLSPPRAARLEGSTVDERLLRTGFAAWLAASEFTVVEGAGGLFSPLGETSLNVDLARDLGLPLVVVDAARLGAIGRTLATVRAALAEGLTIAAVVLSHTTPPTGSADDPTAATRIAVDSSHDLESRLPGIRVGILGHATERIVPDIAWHLV